MQRVSSHCTAAADVHSVRVWSGHVIIQCKKDSHISALADDVKWQYVRRDASHGHYHRRHAVHVVHVCSANIYWLNCSCKTKVALIQWPRISHDMACSGNITIGHEQDRERKRKAAVVSYA